MPEITAKTLERDVIGKYFDALSARDAKDKTDLFIHECKVFSSEFDQLGAKVALDFQWQRAKEFFDEKV